MTARARELVGSRLGERLVALRREIHGDPELSNEEHRTARRLEAALREAGVRELRRVAETGIVARVPGRGHGRGGRAVAIRGDIDALPIGEETGLPFASRNAGVMHACGHDVHATWAVGAAALLVSEPAECDVVVLLQPAEEKGSGALAMIEGGALEGVAAIFGGHVDRRFAVGQIVADAGPLAASADTFVIELAGQGAHAARPHEGADPIVGAAAVVTGLQTIVARRLDPASPGVVTVGMIRAGDAANVIPGRAVLAGTVRATDPASRATMLEEVERIATSIAAAHRLSASVSFDRGSPPIVNPPGPVAWAREAVTGILGAGALLPLGTVNMAAEDFAYYLERVPGCFLRIGAREEGGAVFPAHAPKFQAAEESIFVGAAVLAETARVASRALARG